MTPTNTDRAGWASDALDVFSQETMNESVMTMLSHGKDGNGPDCISDLICNLMHLANQNGFDAHKLVKQGIGNYEFEIENECETCGETDGCDCAG